MKLVFYTASVSPHQSPFAKELAQIVGVDNFRSVYHHHPCQDRIDMGWPSSPTEEWELVLPDHIRECRDMVENSDILLCGIRDVDLFERRSRRGLITAYCCERWFKPFHLFAFGSGNRKVDVDVSGRVRMLVPRYRKMANRIMDLVKTDKNFYLYPYGIHAANDFAWLLKGMGNDKIRTFGYSVSPSSALTVNRPEHDTIRILWVGRFLRLKRVADIVQAVCLANCQNKQAQKKRISLSIFGSGPEEGNLRGLVARLQAQSYVSLQPPVRNDEVRSLMRQHDVYVLSSNALEGWGAVVNEALEEGMVVIGTREAGASGTILPSNCQYSAGDVEELARLLVNLPRTIGIGKWSAKECAKRFAHDFDL